MLETLVRIKKKDPVVYQKDLVLFPKPQEGDEAAGSDAAANKASKGTKPVYLRTVLAKQVSPWRHSWRCRCLLQQ